MIFLILVWLLFCFIVAKIGSRRKIGFGLSFLASLFLSPVIGLLITLISKSNDQIKYEHDLKRTILKQQQTLEKLESNSALEIVERLNKIKELFDSGAINEDEYSLLKIKFIKDGEVLDSCDVIDENNDQYPEPPAYTIKEDESSCYFDDKRKLTVDFVDGKSGEIEFNNDSEDWVVSCTSEPVCFTKKKSAMRYLYHMLSNENDRKLKIAEEEKQRTVKIYEEEEQRTVWQRQKESKQREQKKNNLRAILFLIVFVVLVVLFSILSSIAIK